MDWSPEAQLVSARAAFAMLDGGKLCLYAGEREVAELTFSAPALSGDHLNPLAPDESASGGRGVDTFKALSSGGQVIAEGSVGLVGSGADVELKALNIPHGARVEIESLHFVPGGGADADGDAS